jgi:hypothetical protein
MKENYETEDEFLFFSSHDDICREHLENSYPCYNTRKETVLCYRRALPERAIGDREEEEEDDDSDIFINIEMI